MVLTGLLGLTLVAGDVPLPLPTTHTALRSTHTLWALSGYTDCHTNISPSFTTHLQLVLNTQPVRTSQGTSLNPLTTLVSVVLTNCEHGDRFRHLSLLTLELEQSWNFIMRITLGCLCVGKGFMTFYEYVNYIY